MWQRHQMCTIEARPTMNTRTPRDFRCYFQNKLDKKRKEGFLIEAALALPASSVLVRHSSALAALVVLLLDIGEWLVAGRHRFRKGGL